MFKFRTMKNKIMKHRIRDKIIIIVSLKIKELFRSTGYSRVIINVRLILISVQFTLIFS